MSLNLKAADLAAIPSPADVIYEALRKAIVDGGLRDGQTLRQDQIAGMFNVSRIPVGEALARLVEHGLVTTRRRGGPSSHRFRSTRTTSSGRWWAEN